MVGVVSLALDIVTVTTFQEHGRQTHRIVAKGMNGLLPRASGHAWRACHERNTHWVVGVVICSLSSVYARMLAYLP